MSTRSPASEESLPNRRTLVDQVKSDQNSEAKLVNNRPEAAVQRKLQAVANNSPRVKQLQALQQLANKSVGVQDPTPIQRQAASNTKSPNQTGLPDTLKSGIENLSGHSMDDVKVHYNS
ncbi:MAG TPA: hypothetical protein DCR93_25895, partial [Cytophagales bacterium]|nr:hypothetical protein [Cytophagales bacterium]